MNGFESLTRVTYLLCLLCLAPTWLLAGTQHPSRISYVDGTVAVAHEGSSEWALLERNFPIWGGDRVISEGNSRVEIEFNSETVVRLGSWAGIIFKEFSPERVVVQLLSGNLIVHKQEGPPFRVVSSDSFTDLKDEGVYRFTLLESGETTVRVRKGMARTVQGAVSVSMREGDAWRVGGSGSALTRLYGSDQRDWFDEWSDLRDALRRAQYPSSSKPYTRYAGSRDLNRYGRWGYVSSYGRVWWPHEKSDWIPYQRGRWVHDPSGKMVWISDEPWGWLPYHYGSWVYVSYYSRWCWVPGNFNRWQPALVKFYFGEGYLGWAPRGSAHPGSILDRTRPNRQAGLTVVVARGFRKKRISPDTTIPGRLYALSPGLPPGLETEVQSRRHMPATRLAPRNDTVSRSALSWLKRSNSSSVQGSSRSGSTHMVRRRATSSARSRTTLNTERSSPVLRSRMTRPASNSGKVKMSRYE